MAKASAQTYSPGDYLLLRRGDSWNESFFPVGNGAATSPINMGAYDSGSNPPTLDGGQTLEVGVKFDNSLFTGGWRISDLKIQNFIVAGIDAEKAGGIAASGLTLQNLDITNIQANGSGVPAWNLTSTGGNMVLPAYNVFVSTGVAAWWINNLTISNCRVTYCDMPLNHTGGNNLTLDGSTFDHSFKSPTSIAAATVVYNIGPASLVKTQITDTIVRNCTITYMGYRDGFWAGTAGLQLIGTNRCTVTGTEVAYTGRPSGSPDGIGIDFETGQWFTTIDNCYVHDNSGPAFLMLQNAVFSPFQANTGSVITNNRFYNNGVANPTNLAALCRAVPTASDNMLWRNNRVQYAAGQTNPFGGTTGSPEHSLPLYGLAGLAANQPTWDYDASNTIVP